MLGMLILAEEETYGMVSALRLFSRCDISVYRNNVTGEYEYAISEITRSWSTCLFEPWAQTNGMVDFMMANLAKILRHAIMTKFLSEPISNAPTFA